MNKNVLKNKIIYQIFPRSFYDSNNDGNGDLKGITQKLDYLHNLGINAIWLCPIYDTNFVDAGYDVLDYKNVWSQFGTLEDFKELTSEAKKRGIDIIMDIVLNHVSNEHNWFKKACESRDNVEFNYFIWKDKLNEKEKKAQSIFGGSAWEWVENVKSHYFHLFAKEQVDLNWEHPDTIKAMVDVIDFWYNLGVRGFRLDAIKHVSKNLDEVETNPMFSWCKGASEFLKKFNELAFKDKEDAYTLGEASGITHDELIKYSKGNEKVADNYFNFSWWWIGWGRKTGRNGYDANWNYKEFAYQQKPFQENNEIEAHSFTNFLSNHDTSRSISRWGSENYFRNESAKTHAMMLFSLKGVPCIYYGEEIGQLNINFENRNEFRDCDIHNGFDYLVDKTKTYSEEDFIRFCNINSRDAGRGLMQWNSNINGGFNLGTQPWIKNGRNIDQINVEKSLLDKNSILNFYKKLINLRKAELNDLLINGYSKINVLDSGVIEIIRENEKQKLIALINLTNNELKCSISQEKIILNSYTSKNNDNDFLRPYESLWILEDK